VVVTISLNPPTSVVTNPLKVPGATSMPSSSAPALIAKPTSLLVLSQLGSSRVHLTTTLL